MTKGQESVLGFAAGVATVGFAAGWALSFWKLGEGDPRYLVIFLIVSAFGAAAIRRMWLLLRSVEKACDNSLDLENATVDNHDRNAR